MVGITDFGSYLPFYRYAREELGKAQDLRQAMPQLVCERTVSNYDEDTVTLAGKDSGAHDYSTQFDRSTERREDLNLD